MKANRPLLICVVLPTILSTIYFGWFASDVYVSESRFVVRAAERQTTSVLGLALKGAGFSRSAEDAYAVHDFVLSRDALTQLDTALSVGTAFADSRIDRFSRFAGLDGDASFEALHRYYQKKVSLELDNASSIGTLTVRAFSAKQAREINRHLLEMSEALVNRLSERGRKDLISFAQSEVAVAEGRAKQSSLALSAFRNTESVVDPERQAAVQLQQIAKLQDELIASRTHLIQLQSITAQNPQIPVLKKRVAELDRAIAEESERVTGSNGSLANKAGNYQKVALENEFAVKQFAAAMVSLENARNEAQRKQLYLERIVEPSLPDKAQEPRRLRAILATLVLGLIVWGVASLTLTSVKEHKE